MIFLRAINDNVNKCANYTSKENNKFIGYSKFFCYEYINFELESWIYHFST